MRLLDTRNIQIANWINNSIREGTFSELRIVTGFLYKRGWSALTSTTQDVTVKTISSVHVDKPTKYEFDQTGILPANGRLTHSTKFFSQITQHAKLFLLSGSKTGKSDIAIIGSSNLTGPGLGIGSKKNLELNYIITDPHDVAELAKWFDDLWQESLEPSQVKLVVDENQDSKPDETYFAQLIPGILSFADAIKTLLSDKSMGITDYSLVANERYQLDAVEHIDVRLQRYGCCFLSDDVGLGKTIMGAGIIKRTISRSLFAENNAGSLSTLVICPQPVQGQWLTHLMKVFDEVAEASSVSKDKIMSSVHIATFGQERSIVWNDIGDGIRKSDVRLVLIDEAHRLRNTTNFYRWLSDLDSDLRNAGAKPNYLFLTATPINNSFLDLYNLFKIALPSNFWQESGIDDIQDFLRQIDVDFGDSEADNPSKEIRTFSKALSKLMIRRDVTFLNDHYDAADLARLKIPLVDGDATLVRAANSILGQNAQKIGEYLKKAMFHPYRLAVAYEEMHSSRSAEVQTDVSHVLRAHLSKSLQSSFSAGIVSLQNIIIRCKEILRTGERTAITRLEDDFGQDATDGQVAEDELSSDNAIDQYQLDRVRADSEKDLIHLASFVDFLTSIQEKCDAEKAVSLISTLDQEHPTLVFTEYRATAKWLIQHLKQSGVNVFEGDPDLLENSAELKDELLRLDPSPDSPRSKEKPNFDVYVLTDKYSEGRNFHKCRRIVNYDLPWNPIRKTQRQGRIVRVGSPHDRVKIFSLSYSHKELAEYANPEEVLKEKLRKIAAVFGKGDNKDLLDEGNKFVSYFVRYNRATLGGNSKAKVDSLGIMDSENDSVYFYNIWKNITDSGYVKTVEDFLAEWDKLLKSRDKTIVLNVTDRKVFAAYVGRNSPTNLQWFEETSDGRKPLRISDNFSINCADYRIASRISESSHHEMLVRSPDKNVAKALNKIKEIVAATKVPKLARESFSQALNQASAHKPLEFFNSLKSRLLPLKGNKTELEAALAKVTPELNRVAPGSDLDWVVVCTEAFARDKQPENEFNRSA